MDTPNKTELAVTDRVLAGYLTDIPANRSRHVRVFLSSTTTDMHAERNWIMKKAVPELRTFCRERGLEFQTVDLRWGAKDEQIDDPRTLQLCLQEIQICQTVSIGPTFVALLGDKYGCRPLVSEIEASEFKLIKNTAVDSGYDTTLLTTWYACDYNREPTMYVLQPISSLFPSYYDNSPMNNLLQQQAQREWQTVVEKLHQLFRSVTDMLFRKNRISEETRHKYFQSATESEVTKGILLAGQGKSKTLCFQRTLNGITPKEGVRIAARYTDLIEKKLDFEAEQLREQLRLEKVRFSMPKDNLLRYNLQWDKHGLDISENHQHKSYLEQFGEDFLSSMKEIILSSIEEQSTMYGNSPLLEEVLHHLHLCKIRCSTFSGREMILLDIRDKLRLIEFDKRSAKETKKVSMNGINGSVKHRVLDLNETAFSKEKILIDEQVNQMSLNDKKQYQDAQNDGIYHVEVETAKIKVVFGDDTDFNDSHPVVDINDELNRVANAEEYTTPLVIYGSSGSGKTAITAKCMEQSKRWFPDSVSVVRFLGTTSITMSIREVLVSLCIQISHVFNTPRRVGLDLMVDFHFLVNYLKTLLWRIDTNSRPLVIILDSVDKLATTDHAHSFAWLPLKLPPNVHLIISVSSNRPDCLKQLRSVFDEPDRYVEITSLEKSAGIDMINTLCQRFDSHLAKKQSNLLLDKFEKCGGQPLLLKVLTDVAESWRSFDNIKPDMIGSNVTGAMNQLFDKLEADHSPMLVKHMIAYLCASRDGITDIEMEDILSLDNEVLQDAYMHHLPSDPDVIRLPTLLWKHIYNIVRKFLAERQCGGHAVMTWAHDQFKEIATNRYLTEGNTKQIHQLMAEYFQGVWSSKPKYLHLTRGRKGLFPNAYRQVPAQPLQYNENIYNTRMLSCLPYHLIFSDQYEILLTKLFTDPNWMYARCNAFSLTDLLEDLRLAEAKFAAHIETLKKEVKTSEDMMRGRKQKQDHANTKSTLDKNLDLFESMKIVTKMVLESSEQIRRDPVYLPLQVLGQLGPAYKGMVHLEQLAMRCVEWCRTSNTPLLVPLTDCLITPGGNLLYSIGVEMAAEGANKNHDDRYRRLLLQEDTNILSVTRGQGGQKDQICTFDMVDGGSCIRIFDVNKHIRSMEFTGNNKYIMVEEYTGNDKNDNTSERYLYKSLTSVPITMQSQQGAMTVSQSGKYMAYASAKTVYVSFCKKEMPAYYKIEDHKRPVTCIHITPDDTLLLTTDIVAMDAMQKECPLPSAGQATSRIFDLVSKKLLHTMEPYFKITRKSLITRNNVLICTGTTEKGFIYCYDMVNGNMLKAVQINTEFEPSILQLHASHQYVLCGYRGNVYGESDNGDSSQVTRVFRVVDGTLHGECPVKGSCSEITLFGTAIIYYANCIWNERDLNIYYAGHVRNPLPKGVLIHRLSGHSGPITEILVPSNMTMIITASFDNTVKVWDLKIILHSFHLELTAIEKRLATSSRLDPSPVQVVLQYAYTDTSKQTITTQLCLNRYGDSLYVGTNDGKLLRYSTETGQLKVTEEMNIGAVNVMLLSKSGQYVIAVGSKIHIEDLQSNTHLKLEPPATMTSAAEANNILVCGSTYPESRARVWNIQTGQVLKDINGPYSFQYVSINRTGSKIVASLNTWPAVIPVDGAEIKQKSMIGQEGKITCCEISTNNLLAATGTTNGDIRMADMKGKYLFCLKQKSQVATLTFTHDSKSLVTTGFKSLYVWSTKDGVLRYKVTRHQDIVTNLKFDKTGQFFVSFSNDKQLVLWDFSRGVSIATFHTQCQITGLNIADRAETIAYIPEGLMDVGILKPNDSLKAVIDGHYKPLPLQQKAQALALAFSSQGLERSSTCSIM